MTSSTPRHKLIGFEPAFNLNAAIAHHVQDFQVFPGDNIPHRDALHSAAELVYIHHLGFAGVPPIREMLDRAVEIALDYFLGPEQGDYRRSEYWFQPLSNSLLLGMLAARWDDLAKICAWVRADRRPEYCGPLEYQIPQLYVLMAGSLRPEALEGRDELEASLAKCRSKGPRLLFKAWQAVQAGDQAAFDVAMKQSLAHFASKPPLPPQDAYIGERMARPQTVVCLAAMRRGLKFPEIPEELAARVVTRHSLGLES